jgi:isopenicillin-N epimerase
MMPTTEGSPDGVADIDDAFTLDPTVVYLNHGSFGACPKPVLAAQSAIREQLEREPVRFFSTELAPLLDAARRDLALFVGADPEGLAFVPNATYAVNTVLRSLAFAPGDELLTTDHEYNACKNALDFVAERTGAVVVVVAIPFPIRSEDEIVSAVLEKVSPRTRLALLDHVTSPTALVFPIARLVRELQVRGIETLVDGAHAIGMLPLDLTAMGVAYYTSNCHKWLCAPKGAAFLFVREDRRPHIVPLAISHGRNARLTGRSRFRLLFDWTGTDDPSPYLAVPEAIRFVSNVVPGGPRGLFARNHALILWARDRLCAALDIAPPAPDSMLGSMASIPLPTASATAPDVDPLKVALMDRYRIEVPVFSRVDAKGAVRRSLRISAQAYNRRAQYDELAEALRSLLDRPR